MSIFIYIIEYTIWLMDLKSGSIISESLLGFINNQRSPLNIIFGYTLFYFFININIKYNKMINVLASTMFAILLIHDSNYFRNIIWECILSSRFRNVLSNNIKFVFGYLGVVLGLAFGCSIIDLIRQNTIEKWLRGSKLFVYLSEKINNIFDLSSN